MFLFFLFRSHTHLFGPTDKFISIRYAPRNKQYKYAYNTNSETPEHHREEEEEEEEQVTPRMSLPLLVSVAVVGCALITALSEYLVSALSNLTSETSLTKQWVGLILIPLAGTFTRHDLIEAAQYGWKDAMNDSLG